MTADEVRSLIASTLGLRTEQVHDDLAFGEVPEWDSVAHVELMLALEERLAVEITPDEMVELASAGLIADFAAAPGSSRESGA